MTCYPRPNTQRSPTALRPLTAELSPLSRPDGSASLHVGNTHVLCAVHGPVAPRSTRWERYEGGVVSVAFSRGLISSSSGSAGAASGGGDTGGSSSGAPTADENVAMGAVNTVSTHTATPTSSSKSMKSLPLPLPPGLGATERELEYFLRDALSSCILLERYPRCVIQVVLQIVQADGSVLGSAVNCAVLALMDAGVAMRGLPIASTCVVIDDMHRAAEGEDERDLHGRKDSKPTVWLDPTAEEESGVGHATVVLVTDMATSSHNTSIPSEDDNDDDAGGIITSMTFGAPLSIKGLLASAECAKQSSAAMVAFMRLAIEQKVQRESQTLWS
ncbi:hypothetical protein ACHAWU_000230 [Discostella pseudostelligera]|uniref:Exoribonuclease phosphorolytic domain-containing protein n=1 Tax=Discostella pseudostelligera TaxID=259834 RepID=A0ABD3MVY9_9STRA